MKVAGRFDEVEPWNGIPGIDIGPHHARVLKARGVPVHEWKGHVRIGTERAMRPKCGKEVGTIYRVATPIAVLLDPRDGPESVASLPDVDSEGIDREGIELAVWIAREYGVGAVLDAIYRFVGWAEFPAYVRQLKQEAEHGTG